MWSLSFYFWRCVLQFAGGEPRAAGQCGFDLGQASYGFNWLRNNYIVEREKKGGRSERRGEVKGKSEKDRQTDFCYQLFREGYFSCLCQTTTYADARPFSAISQKDTYLALATSRVSVKRKRCLSWVCRPVFSCDWAWPRNTRPGHSARKAWTRGQDSGLTGVRQLSLRDKKTRQTHNGWNKLVIPREAVWALDVLSRHATRQLFLHPNSGCDWTQMKDYSIYIRRYCKFALAII